MSQSPSSRPEQLAQQNISSGLESIPRSYDNFTRSSKTPNPLSPHVLALLIPASTLGSLARIGLFALANYDGHSIFPLAYAQATGCLIMGFTLELKEPFSRFYPQLYIAVATGFCGSLTTFSGWQLDIFNSWMNSGAFQHGPLRDFLDGAGKSVFTVLISLASVSFGMQLASVVYPRFPALPSPGQKIRYSLTALPVLSYAAVYPAYFLLPVDIRHQATAALLFSFPGTLTRYILSVQLNLILKTIPLGTFTANSLGTVLMAVFHTLQNTSRPVSPGVCIILQGLSDGYCGCLTTVSTFVVEIRGMNGWKGFWYGLLSWSMGQLLLLVVLGPSLWSGRAKEQITCRFV